MMASLTMARFHSSPISPTAMALEFSAISGVALSSGVALFSGVLGIFRLVAVQDQAPPVTSR